MIFSLPIIIFCNLLFSYFSLKCYLFGVLIYWFSHNLILLLLCSLKLCWPIIRSPNQKQVIFVLFIKILLVDQKTLQTIHFEIIRLLYNNTYYDLFIFFNVFTSFFKYSFYQKISCIGIFLTMHIAYIIQT